MPDPREIPAHDRSSLARHALAALALVIAFYAVVLGVGLALILWPFHAELEVAGQRTTLIAFCVPLGLAFLAAARPRHEPFFPPGPPVDATQQERLFRLVHEVAHSLGERLPDEVYLTADANAGVTHFGGVLGFGQKRVLYLGLPFAHGLSVDALRVVLAHEFGHFAGAHSRLACWAFRTRESLERTVERLAAEGSLFALPFRIFGRLYVRVTDALSRRMELAADAVAARLLGPRASCEALRAAAELVPAFQQYLHTEFLPVLDAGRRPPLLLGFATFLSSAGVKAQLARYVAQEMQRPMAIEDDTHPPLGVRVRAIEAGGFTEPAGRAADARPASVLLDDPPRLELALLEAATGDAQLRLLGTIAWAAVGRELLLPRFRAVRDALPRERCAPVSLADLPQLFEPQNSAVPRILEALGVESPPPGQGESAEEIAATALGQAGFAALVDAGFAFETEPGEPMTARRGAHGVELVTWLHEFVAGRLDAEAYRARAVACGIDRVGLMAPQPAEPASRAVEPSLV